ncbi:MAG TPA: DUF2298 domain-containing protein [Thermomicrobiales bacterium]|nr:DUF2298 domain-containing protein [Thermomicrobiales bacterium]
MPDEPAHSRPFARTTLLALLAILIAGLSLRLFDVNWDQGKNLHPDELFVSGRAVDVINAAHERGWSDLLDPELSPINPRSKTCDDGRNYCNYSYGALPLLVVDGSAQILKELTGTNYTGFDEIKIVGRKMSAMVDTVTILLIFLLATRLFGQGVGLLSAATYAATPLAIQLSHFFTTDIWLAFFVTLTLWCALLALERERHGWFMLAGFTFGLALATKGSVILLAGVVALSALYLGWRRLDPQDPIDAILGTLSRWIVAGVGALIGFALFEPYALVRSSVYINQLQEQQMMSTGEIDFPYTRRYVGTTMGVYQFEQLFRWAMGPVATALAIVGIVMMIVMVIRHRRFDVSLLLVWLALQGVVILLPQIKFLRYQIPIMPVLAIGSGLAMWTGFQWLRSKWNVIPATAFATACLVGIALWTTAFMHIYEGDQSRIAASKWIYANVPMGSAITDETWDEQIPVPIGPLMTADDMDYTAIHLDIYGDRPQEEVSDYLFSQLQQADFVIQSSNRLRESVAREPWRYPVQIAYYQMLDSGQLGFTLVADFQTEPKIGPIKFDDGLADESWVNYDHPRVRIYQKTSTIDRATWDQLFSDAVASPWIVSRNDPTQKTLMLDEPVGQLTPTTDFRWSERWTHNSGVAFGFWVALLVLFSIVGFPWARLLFPRAPDGGTGLARSVTLIIAGWLMWFTASLKLTVFSSVWSWICLAITAVVGFVLWWTLSDRSRRFPKVVITGAEVAFWAVFGLFLLYRWVNPDSWHPSFGGEKPMEFAHLNATLRSAHFPPYDPWFAGGYINYYYYGLYLVAYAIKLTGIPAEIAFNLAQPTIMGMMASGAYSLAAALVGTRKRVSQSVITGFLAVILVTLIGNLFDFVNWIKVFPGPDVVDFGKWVWDPSRAIPGAITEFPYFTGLYADLHAHGINVPNTLVMLSLCLTLARDPNLTSLAIFRRRIDRTALLFTVRILVLGLLVGTVATTNSWDAAEYVAFLAVALFMTTLGVRPFLMRLVVTAGLTGVAGVTALITFAPFYTHYVALFSSIGRTSAKTEVTNIWMHFGIFFAILGVGVTALLLARQRDRVFPPMADPLLPIAIVAAGMAVAIATNWELNSNTDTIKIAVGLACLILTIPVVIVTVSHELRWVGDLGIGAGVVAFLFEVALILDDRGTLALCFAFFLLGGALWVFASDRAERMTGALVACGAGIVGAIELVYLQDNLANGDYERMNTIFKFYNQVWVLFGVASAVILGKALRAAGWLAWSGTDREQERGWWESLPVADADVTSSTVETSLVADDLQPEVIEVEPVEEPSTFAGIDHLPERPRFDDQTGERIIYDDLPETVVPFEVVDPVLAVPAATDDIIPDDESLANGDGWEWSGFANLRRRTRMNMTWAKATALVGAAFILMGLVYPIIGTRSRLDLRFEGHPGVGTLNSYDWMKYGTITGWDGHTVTFDGDYDAIYWFINNVKGSPVIMEAAIGPYRGNGSRFSISTGLPDVMGWDNHETQQRYVADIGPHQIDTQTFYDSVDLDQKLQILARYDVQYVIVGDVERYSEFHEGLFASEAGISMIEGMVGTYLEVAFQSGNTTVYRVITSALPPLEEPSSP